jgi:glycosyltransferase involved in cell wall biosynthesis
MFRFSGLIANEILKGRICYIPWIESEDLQSYLDITDICLAPFHKNPQHESGVANKIYEYMQGGKPLVVSNCLPQQQLVMKYYCGLVFENNAEFHDRIITLLKDLDLRQKMGINGKQAILYEYNVDLLKEKLLSIYMG